MSERFGTPREALARARDQGLPRDAAMLALEAYRLAVVRLGGGDPGARAEVEQARRRLASPALVEGLVARICELERIIAGACSCGASPLPCVMHETSEPVPASFSRRPTLSWPSA